MSDSNAEEKKKSFFETFRENPGDLRILLWNLMEGLGPAGLNERGSQNENFGPRAKWFLDPENASAIRNAVQGLAMARPQKGQPYFAPEKVEYFAGSGARSVLWSRHLFDRLQHGLTMVSYNNQEGLCGTTYDEQDVAKRVQEIRLVVEDIAYALLGERARDLVNFDLHAFGDVSYQRKVPACVEAGGPAAVKKFLDRALEKEEPDAGQ